MVPEGWRLACVDDIASVASGGTPSRKHADYWNGSIPWVTTSEVQFGTIYDTGQKISANGLANSSAKLFPPDTILMAMYGQGKTRGQVAKLGIEATTNQACAAILLKDGYEVDYYFQFFMSRYEHIRDLANSGGQQNLSSGIVKSIQVPIPPLSEQKKIAKILSTWDKAIATTEKLLANSQQQKKALMQQLLAGTKRLPGFSGTWRTSHLGDWLQEYSEKSISSDQYEVLTSSRRGLVKQSDYYGVNRITERDSTGFNVIPPGFMTYRSRSDDGLFTFNKNDLGYTGVISTYYPVFKFVLGDDDFFLDLLNYKSRLFSAYSVGTSQKVLSLSALKSIKLPLPEKEEQRAIASVLMTSNSHTGLFQEKLDWLKREKQALMQQLLTGRRRVNIGRLNVA